MNKILIVTGWRTSSTYRCQVYSNKYLVPNLGELGTFRKPGEKHFDHPSINSSNTVSDVYNFLEHEPAWILKLIPLAVTLKLSQNCAISAPTDSLRKKYDQFLSVNADELFKPHMELSDHLAEFYAPIFRIADRVYYLYRKDFKAQVRSYAVALETNWQEDRIDDEILHIKVKDETILFAADAVKDNWLHVQKLYNSFPGEVIALEDIEHHLLKFRTNIAVSGNFSLVEDFDVAQSIFNIND
jgi:hypothetical protein